MLWDFQKLTGIDFWMKMATKEEKKMLFDNLETTKGKLFMDW